MSKMPALSLAATCASALLWASLGLAQDVSKSKDDALDKLLEKLDDSKSPDNAKPTPKPTDDAAKPKDDALDKLLEKIDDTKSPDKTKPSTKPGDGTPNSGDSKPGGGVAPKDKALDNLLEKLGETTDAPSPDDRPKGAPAPPADEPPPSKSDKPRPNELKGQEKDLDQHLEELTGRKRKKKDGGGEGPLGQVIKEMREVEERLGKPDTGEDTRKKQAEIVKKLESVIEQLRQQSQSQSRGRTKRYLVIKPGKQNGSNPNGQNPGAMSGNGLRAKPQKPQGKRSLAQGEEWGHLPPELRQELDNIFKEEALPLKEDLIRRYYLSVSKKTLVRGE
jgi:hypothetical protein